MRSGIRSAAVRRIVVPGVLFLFAAAMAAAGPQEKSGRKPGDDAKELQELEAKIAKTPDDPALHCRRAQCLMKAARYADGYEAARKAMALFVEKNDPQESVVLEQVDLQTVRVEVQFNMGPRERRPPPWGIIRPLSFRVLSKEKEPKLLESIDFEIGMMKGKPTTAALGQMAPGGGHANFGVMNPDSKYEEIRKRALALIGKRHSK